MHYVIFTFLILTLGSFSIEDKSLMNEASYSYGIKGQIALELSVKKWVNGDGESTDPINLSDHNGKGVVLYCFQAWYPGCHSRGLPTLQKLVE